MNVEGVSAALAIEKYKSEILQLRANRPQDAERQTTLDSVNITDIGRVLSDLSKAGNASSTALISSILAGRPDDNLEVFLQAYCYAYGIDISGQVVYYDKNGKGRRSSYYEALKKYLSTFADYLLQEPDEKDPVAGFLKAISLYLQKIKKYFIQ